MTSIQYYEYKNKYFSFPIASMTAFPNYVAGSEFFRIYSSFDTSDSLGFVGRPAGVEYNEYTPAIWKNGPPSIKTSWFPVIGSKVFFSNGSYLERISNPSTTWSSPIQATFAAISLKDPNGNRVCTGNNSNEPDILLTSGPYTDSGLATSTPPQELGGWLMCRMQYENFDTYLTDLKNLSDSAYMYMVFPYKKTFLGMDKYYAVRMANTSVPYYSNGKTTLYNFFKGLPWQSKGITTGHSTDPSVPQGGVGNYEDLSGGDEIPVFDPTVMQGANSLAGIKTHQLTNISLPAFHDFMFSDVFNNTWDSIRKSLGSPQECVVGLRALYVPVTVGSSSEISLGNIATGVTAPEVNKDFIQIDCGSVSIPEIWGNFLDYDPYTNISLYLPYCTTVQLSANEVVGSTLNVTYNIDVMTGSCSAEVHATKTDKFGETSGVILRATGNCSVPIPWSMTDATNQWRAVIGSAATIATAGISIGAAAAGASAAAGTASVASHAATNVATSATSILQTIPEITHGEVVRGGNSVSVSGALQHPKPYLTIRRPVQSLAENYGRYYGYPSNITKKLSELSGFTKVGHINLENIPGTSEELILIQQALQSGVIL